MPVVMVRNNNLIYHCHHCGLHSIPVLIGRKEDKSWEWNGDHEKPTVKPSVNHFYPDSHYEQHPNCPKYRCHYFISNGNIEYCSDCTHEHAGKVMALIPFTEAEVKLNSMGE